MAKKIKLSESVSLIVATNTVQVTVNTQFVTMDKSTAHLLAIEIIKNM